MAGSDRGRRRDGSIVTEAPQMLHDLNASVKTPAVDRTENTEILEETELEEENHASLLWPGRGRRVSAPAISSTQSSAGRWMRLASRLATSLLCGA